MQRASVFMLISAVNDKIGNVESFVRLMHAGVVLALELLQLPLHGFLHACMDGAWLVTLGVL